MDAPFPITVDHCPRCNYRHRTLVARPMKQPIGPHRAFAICPRTFGPILVREDRYRPGVLAVM